MASVCTCRCHGEDVPPLTDPIAVVFACALCRTRHVLAQLNADTPYEPPGERKPFDPGSDSQRNSKDGG